MKKILLITALLSLPVFGMDFDFYGSGGYSDDFMGDICRVKDLCDAVEDIEASSAETGEAAEAPEVPDTPEK